MDDEPIQHNLWNDDALKETPATEYVALNSVISFDGFDYGKYREGEESVLQPRLEERGYRDIRWSPGETDSFGPLTRVCRATNSMGYVFWFIYG